MELIFTLIVASLLSGVVVFIASFALANFGVPAESLTYTATGGATVWGLIVGYKLNTLLQKHR